MPRPNQIRWKSAVVILSGLLSLALPELHAEWTMTTNLPDGYADHALLYKNGFLYSLGGFSFTSGEADGTNVFFSQVYSNGTVGVWNKTTALPEACFQHGGVSANGFVYVLGGLHYTDASGDFLSAVVYYTKIQSDGSLGSWHTANPLPQPVALLSAVV